MNNPFFYHDTPERIQRLIGNEKLALTTRLVFIIWLIFMGLAVQVFAKTPLLNDVGNTIKESNSQAVQLLASQSTTHQLQEELWYTDVIETQPYHLSVNFWLNQLNNKLSRGSGHKVKVHNKSNNVLMSKTQIASFNRQLVQDNPYISAPISMAASLSDNALQQKIAGISRIPKSDRFFANGVRLTPENYTAYLKNTNQIAVQPENVVQFGLVTKRSVLRAFPTRDRVFRLNDQGHLDQDLDLFQESGIFPGEAVAILHKSEDKQWLLVQAYHYTAWMPAQDVAIGTKQQIHRFLSSSSFIVVTGSKVFTNTVPKHIAEGAMVSGIQLEMGVKLPLAQRHEFGHSLYGQNTYTSHIVKMPIRNKVGRLSIALAAIAKSQDVSVGYLALTKENLIKQSFKFLGERYGWGHDFNGRDCTGFVGEIYKSFGLLMPRNSGQQAKSNYGETIRFSNEASQAEKLESLRQLEVGDLLYMPGHVMMFLGYDDLSANKVTPYIIHDVKDMKYKLMHNSEYQGTLNGVSVTPLLTLKDYVSNLSAIKRMRLSHE